MLSDITFKGIAMTQLAMYEKLRECSNHYSSYVTVPMTLGICVTDIVLDTAKYPIMAVENAAFAAINVGGAGCFEECRLADAYQNLKNITTLTFVATPVMTFLSIPKLLSHLCVTLPNPAHAHSTNQEADREARLQAIVYSRQLAPQ
jgi:hypothetical protein